MHSLVSQIAKMPGNCPLPTPGVWVKPSTQKFFPPIQIVRFLKNFAFLPKMSSLELTSPVLSATMTWSKFMEQCWTYCDFWFLLINIGRSSCSFALFPEHKTCTKSSLTQQHNQKNNQECIHCPETNRERVFNLIIIMIKHLIINKITGAVPDIYTYPYPAYPPIKININFLRGWESLLSKCLWTSVIIL